MSIGSFLNLAAIRANYAEARVGFVGDAKLDLRYLPNNGVANRSRGII